MKGKEDDGDNNGEDGADSGADWQKPFFARLNKKTVPPWSRVGATHHWVGRGDSFERTLCSRRSLRPSKRSSLSGRGETAGDDFVLRTDPPLPTSGLLPPPPPPSTSSPFSSWWDPAPGPVVDEALGRRGRGTVGELSLERLFAFIIIIMHTILPRCFTVCAHVVTTAFVTFVTPKFGEGS